MRSLRRQAARFKGKTVDIRVTESVRHRLAGVTIQPGGIIFGSKHRFARQRKLHSGPCRQVVVLKGLTRGCGP